MGTDATFIITVLIPSWKQGEHTFGPTMARWILKIPYEKCVGELGYDNAIIKQELYKSQPQLSDLEVLDIEYTNILIA
ncbi:MAG: hypothetical protein CV087_17510 [Candidatus Brocadia sp. WS118]|nr:MAG: hypothetical protein CV087_17510 [Candidatus Brocadia sp. WS118]